MAIRTPLTNLGHLYWLRLPFFGKYARKRTSERSLIITLPAQICEGRNVNFLLLRPKLIFQGNLGGNFRTHLAGNLGTGSASRRSQQFVNRMSSMR